MNSETYQLATLRARFAARGYAPLNTRRTCPSRWLLIAALITIAIIAARSF